MTNMEVGIFMISRILGGILVAVAVGLLCLFAGNVLVTLSVPIAVTTGHFLAEWGWVIGVLAGLWYFLKGGIVI